MFISDGNSHKSIFIEKPLISKNLSKREKNEKFFKKSLICTLTKEPTLQSRRFGANRRKMNESQENEEENEDSDQNEIRKKLSLERFETEAIDYDLISNIETFGFGDETLQQKKHQSDVETTRFDRNIKSNVIEKKDSIKETTEVNILEKPSSDTNDDSNSSEDSNLVIDVPENSELNEKTLIMEHEVKKPEEREDGELMGPASPEQNDSDKVLKINNSERLAEEVKHFNPKVIPLEKPPTQNILPSLNDLMSRVHDNIASSPSANQQSAIHLSAKSILIVSPTLSIQMNIFYTFY